MLAPVSCLGGFVGICTSPSSSVVVVVVVLVGLVAGNATSVELSGAWTTENKLFHIPIMLKRRLQAHYTFCTVSR